MATQISDALFDAVVNYLDITWTLNPGEEKKLSGIIARGEAEISRLIPSCDFESETPERSLLLDYCMYVRSGARDEFFKNYSSDIISLQIGRWEGADDAEDQKSNV